ncbi:MAG TPA: oxygen-independent coproporphyrinogen III oxidase [Opitutaceae bacterium]|nr:oxygen-independent coproporphyrinogen III oxidase [Opitutaceae bacterium]
MSNHVLELPTLELSALLAKYDAPVPRYTSYPTAPHFRTEWDHSALREDFIRDNRSATTPLSLYVHLPFCEQKCWFCGCTTVITRDHSVTSRYLDDLEREMDLIASNSNHRRPVVQVHLGGGTPTFLSPEELLRLGRGLRSRFNFAPHVEFSVEIDPRHLTPDQVQVFREIGCTRASLGIQDFNTAVQIAVHRYQPKEMTETAVARLREAGFKSINFDLIYGLPQQTPESFVRTVGEALVMQPDRLALFSYAHLPRLKPAQRIFDRRYVLPSASEKLSMMVGAVQRIASEGYACIGMDHFAKVDDELAVAQRRGDMHRNFQGYTTCGGATLYGFGMSAISSSEYSYRQNTRDLARYRELIRAGQLPTERACLLGVEDRLRWKLIQKIMCGQRLDFAELSLELGVNVREHFAPELASLNDLADDGLIEVTDDSLVITAFGRLLVRAIAVRFDLYYNDAAASYSRTI